MRKRGQRLLRAFAARLGDAYRLLDVARLLLNLSQGLRLGGEIAFGLRERGLQRALFSRGGFAPGQCRGKLFLALASLGIDRRDLRVEAGEQLGDLRGLLRQPSFALAREL